MMRPIFYAAVLLGLALLNGSALAQTAPKPSAQSDAIKDYLVDVGAGPVAAADLIGVSSSAVTDVQNLKDLNVLLTPSTGSDQQAGMGLQFAPFRSQWSTISANDYMNSAGARFLGSLSLSYAQNKAKYGDVDYRQQAAALHAHFYPNPADDPIYNAHEAFASCQPMKDIQFKVVDKINALLVAAERAKGSALTQPEQKKIESDYKDTDEYKRQVAALDPAIVKCVADAARNSWNKTLLAATIGEAWIRPETGAASSLTLARSLSLQGVYGPSANSALNFAARFSWHELDTDTLAKTPAYKNNNLVAARYTYRGAEDSTLFGLAEVSNAKSSDAATISNAAFKYALGLDAKVFNAVWLEFRVGRARSSTSGTPDETKALMSIKWSATPSLPTVFAPRLSF